ncbi:cyclic nucleotide-binding domain protein (macronuclear) [Tetrahymena thermophila SB210]|uniref:Cyclic nucleotide-binding domain protein n=1 Tax=Tetrahymena thermophila (strain SB210) TaxID=312017 RepID=Q23S28_TETTS|nr:cyclic nucleotide-binding domain protein [Tetrahymena thermophila SB210]EAR99319.2 cyclic nucleotide-binding domain protein [Tetrahymena thermophila SB210]|eukprot:XP_001019564.2 cyclic nucleotide-binding domain protein [Tetrahymena thermophila SB210]
MRLSIQKLNFEKTQKEHDEMVEIFHQRQNEKTLTEDEIGTKMVSTNRVQSSFQELSTKQIFQDNNFSKKIPNIGQVLDSKKRLQYYNEDNSLKYAQTQNDVSSIQNESSKNNHFSFIKKEQKYQQSSLSASVQYESKSLILDEQVENKTNILQIGGINSGLNFIISPTFRKKSVNSQTDTPLDQQNFSQQEGLNLNSPQVYSNIDSKFADAQDKSQSIQFSCQKSNQQDLIEQSVNDQGRDVFSNQSQSSGIAIESSNKKQKQSQVSQIESKKKESKKFTEVEKQIHQKKTQKRTVNFIHIIMKMKNYAYKMTSNIESKRLALLQRQNFFYLRDKTINYDNQEKEGYEFYDYSHFQKLIHLIFQLIQSINLLKGLIQKIPTIPLFLPQSLWKFIWDIFNMIIVIIFFFYLPLYFIYGILFKEVFYFEGLDILLAIIATLDIFINLNTVLYRKGNLLHSRTLILLEYISKNGLLNITFVAILWIVLASQRSQLQLIQNYRFSIIFFVVALFKVFKQNSFKNRIYDRFYLRKINRGIISLMQIFFNLFIVSHVFACIWLVVGKINQTQDSIICGQQDPDIITNNCSYTWLDKLKGIQNLTFYEQYLRAYYFTTVTMITVGYGDITPVNSIEYLLSILTMLIACGMFGYSLNSIGQILSEMDINNKEYDEHFNAIYGYMHKKNVSTDLQVQVREYLQYYFIQSNQEDIQKQQKVIQLLPETLQNQIMLEANKIIFESSKLFKNNFSEQIIQKTIKLIEQKEFRPGQKIISQNEENDNFIYFIEKGSVEIYNSNNNEQLKLLHKGDQFGEIQFFTGQVSQVSVRSVEFTKLLVIKRSCFFELIQSSPLDLERYCMIKDSILYSNKLEMAEVFCYCCKSSNHFVTQCNFIHLQLDKYKIIKEYVKNDFQVRDQDIQRRKFSYQTLQIQDQIEDRARQFVDDNIEDLYTQGWFNELIQLEFQDQIIQFKCNNGNASHPSLKTVNQQQNQQYFQKMKTNQNIQNQLSNIKIQYQKAKNIIANIQDSQSMNIYSELYPFDKSSTQIQQKSNNNFQHALSALDDFSQSPHAFNLNKKVQFSTNSLQENNEDNQADNKSIQVQSSQFINNNIAPINFHHYQTVGDCSNFNTPTNRQRHQSNISESSPKSANNNIYVNVNSANYYHQNSGQNNINNQPMHGIQYHNPYINDIIQQYAYYESSNQLSNQDTYSQVGYQNVQDDNQFYNRQINQQKIANQNEKNQKQKEYANLRESIKKSTLITEALQRKKSFNPLLMSKQLSSINQRQVNEALIKQLKELVQMPHGLTMQQGYLQFETLKNYQVYLPQNNYDRVILSYSVLLRKNQAFQQIYKTKKSFQNKNDNEKLIKIQKTQVQNNNENSKKSIQYLKNILKQNQLESNQEESNEENHKKNSTG